MLGAGGTNSVWCTGRSLGLGIGAHPLAQGSSGKVAGWTKACHGIVQERSRQQGW